MNEIINEPLDVQEKVASCMVANIIAQSAEVVWERVYKNSHLQDQESPYIKGIIKWSYELMNGLYGCHKPHVNMNESKPVNDAVNVLCRKMIKWLYK